MCLDSTPEEWRAAPGLDGWYEVSNLGRVRRVRFVRRHNERGLPIKSWVDRSGYVSVVIRIGLRQTSRKVHSMVARAFLGDPEPGHEVNHIDGDKTHVCARNLEWVTRSQNMRHAYALGLNVPRQGEAHWKAKLTPSDVQTIRALRGHMRQADIGRQYGITQAQVSEIQLRKTWRHLT
jgi:hypothetical protein